MYNVAIDGWSIGLRSRVQIPIVSRGFCDEQLHLFTSHGRLYNYYQYNVCTIYVCLSVIYYP
jgi:hypothetical protein